MTLKGKAMKKGRDEYGPRVTTRLSAAEFERLKVQREDGHSIADLLMIGVGVMEGGRTDYYAVAELGQALADLDRATREAAHHAARAAQAHKRLAS